MLIDRRLPRQEFFDGQRVAGAGFLERKQSAAHGSDYFRLTADNPAFCARRRQVSDRQRTAIGPDHILDPRAVGFGHFNSLELLTNLRPAYRLRLKIWLSV